MAGEFTPTIRWAIIRRDSDVNGQPVCTWCGQAVRIEPGGYSLQHRRARGMGGSRLRDTGQAQNGCLVHGTGTTGCHGYIESHPVEAAERGFRIRQTENPLTVPVRAWDGRVLFLTVDGRAIESTDPEW